MVWYITRSSTPSFSQESGHRQRARVGATKPPKRVERCAEFWLKGSSCLVVFRSIAAWLEWHGVRMNEEVVLLFVPGLEDERDDIEYLLEKRQLRYSSHCLPVEERDEPWIAFKLATCTAVVELAPHGVNGSLTARILQRPECQGEYPATSPTWIQVGVTLPFMPIPSGSAGRGEPQRDQNRVVPWVKGDSHPRELEKMLDTLKTEAHTSREKSEPS